MRGRYGVVSIFENVSMRERRALGFFQNTEYLLIVGKRDVTDRTHHAVFGLHT